MSLVETEENETRAELSCKRERASAIMTHHFFFAQSIGMRVNGGQGDGDGGPSGDACGAQRTGALTGAHSRPRSGLHLPKCPSSPGPAHALSFPLHPTGNTQRSRFLSWSHPIPRQQCPAHPGSRIPETAGGELSPQRRENLCPQGTRLRIWK